MLQHVSASNDDHLQGARNFLAYAVYASTYKVGILYTKYYYYYLLLLLLLLCGPGSVVGIATVYGLDGPGIESRWGEIFRTSPDRH